MKKKAVVLPGPVCGRFVDVAGTFAGAGVGFGADGVVVDVDDVSVTGFDVLVPLEGLDDGVLTATSLDFLPLSPLPDSFSKDHLAPQNTPKNSPPITRIPRIVITNAVGRETDSVALM